MMQLLHDVPEDDLVPLWGVDDSTFGPYGVTLPYGVSQDRYPCVLHQYHSPITVVNELHHLFPLYLQQRAFGDQVTHDNTRIAVCSTGHNTIHAAITSQLNRGPWPTWCVGDTRVAVLEALTRFKQAGGSW